jgi:capsular exopolysaccharide synthesis family protein
MYQAPDDDEWDLRHYVSVLWRRKLLVLSVVLVLVGAALAWSVRQESRYRSTAEVLLQGNVGETILSPDPQTDRASSSSRSRVETEIEVMQSRSVQRAVADKLGRQPKVTIKQRGETDVVAISATDTDPARAAAEAQTYAEVFIETRREQLVQGLLDASEKVQAELDPIREQIANAQKPLAELDARITAATADFDSFTQRALEAQRQALATDIDRQLSGLRARETSYATQLDELRLATTITRTGGIQIVSEAVVPDEPFAPRPLRSALVALALALVLGVVLAFLRDHYDDTIKSKDDLDLAAKGHPVLGLIPGVRISRKGRREPAVVSQRAPQSVVAEAYRALRTSIHVTSMERPLKILQVSSPNAAEGKTTTLANLAVSLARADSRVVLVDCDLRRPQLHAFFGVDNVGGFGAVLAGEATVAESLRSVPDEPNVRLLTAGPPPPNPSELLASRRTTDILRTLADQFDYVLVDGPAVLPVTDGLVLSGKVDGVILLAAANSTTRRNFSRALEILSQVEAPIIGTVLNMATRERSYAYPYGSYTADDGGGARRRRGGRGERTGPDVHPNGEPSVRAGRLDTTA